MKAFRRFLNRPIQAQSADTAEPFFAPAQKSVNEAPSESVFLLRIIGQPPESTQKHPSTIPQRISSY